MQTNILFTSTKVGKLTLANRFVMAPLTRGRADADRSPNDLMAEYYEQRASAGLIITEATAISPQGYGWFGAPAIYNSAHVDGWRKITNAVHRNGGRIFLQLWHMGRVSHPDFQGGALPVGPSAIAARDEAHTAEGKKPYVTPRALETSEIPGIVRDYANATRLARDAWFDGVEIHAANGYLPDQFLRDGSNHRTDRYGGSVENRARFLLEVTEAVAAAWSPERVGVRLSPKGTYNDMHDSDPLKTFTYAAHALNKYGLAYLHVFEGLPGHWSAQPGERVTPHMRRLFKGPLIVNGGYDRVTATRAVAEGEAHLAAFGTQFIANPDLVERFRVGGPLNTPDPESFYTPGARGYTDYPVLAEALV
jgi:N-ethylmaleimide reductase